MGLRYSELSPSPKRPHDFYSLERRYVPVRMPGREAPVRLSYVEAGSGPPMLLVHGLMTSAYSFRYVVSALAKRYRVLVPDLPGAGKSDAPVDLPMTPERLVNALDGFLAAAGVQRAYVVGNSIGGYLSLWLALLRPERVERLCVMHAPGFPELRLYALKAALALPGANGLLRWLTRQPEQFVIDNVHYRDPGLMSQEEAREYAAIFRDPARTAVFARVLAETMDPFAMRRLPEAVRQRREAGGLPDTLLLWSTEDALVPPEYGRKYQALLPKARLRWLQGTSHFMHVDTPEETVRELLEFGEAR